MEKESFAQNKDKPTPQKHNAFSYHAFASRMYRTVTYVLIPIGLFLLQGFLLAKWKISIIMVVTILLPGYFVLADIMVFGASCARQSSWAEYLKSSVWGRNVLQRALIWDCVLRFAGTVLIIGGLATEEWFFLGQCCNQTMPAEKAVLLTSQWILTVYAASTLCMLIARHFTQTPWYLFFAAIGMYIPSAIYTREPSCTTLITAILLAASILFSAATVKITMKKMRRSYYDETVDETI